MVFTAGAPGSGKTYTLHRLYGLHNLEMLDLDRMMPQHPHYDASCPEALYARQDAYNWANERVETRFQEVCRQPWHDAGRDNDSERARNGRFICFDGTGTHAERQKRRMWDAKRAGFWVTHVFVQVSLETCLRRNRQRERRVPEDVLRDYISRLEGAVKEVSHEPGLVDEMIAMNNDREDEHSSEEDRWGEHLDWVQATSRRHGALFDDWAPR